MFACPLKNQNETAQVLEQHFKFRKTIGNKQKGSVFQGKKININ